MEEGVLTAEKIRKMVSETTLLLLLAEPEADGLIQSHRMKNTGVLAKPFFVSAVREKILEMRQEEEKEAIQDNEKNNSLEGLRFLAAEDNEINAEILTEILEMEGAGCEIAENGQRVLERFADSAEGEFDAILMDVQMPVMNGYEATRAIRALERRNAKTIPIIAMTANAFAEDEKEALEAGMNVHVAKPIDIELLKKAIRQCMEREE